MFDYQKEQADSIVLDICKYISTRIQHRSIAKTSDEIDMSRSSLTAVINAARTETIGHISIDRVAKILHRMQDTPNVYVSVDTDMFCLTGETNVLLGECALRVLVSTRARHRDVSREEMGKMMGLSSTQMSSISQRQFNNITTTSLLNFLRNMGIEVKVGLADKDSANVIPFVKDLTYSAAPVSDIVSSIRHVARHYFKVRGLTVEFVATRSGQGLEQVNDFLINNNNVRLPMQIAIPIAKACGCTVSVSIT